MGNICEKFDDKSKKSKTFIIPRTEKFISMLNSLPSNDNLVTQIQINKSKTLKKVSLKDFTHIRVLSQGTFGRVLLVKKKDNNQFVKHFAMKIINKSNILNLGVSLQLEKKILQYQRNLFLVHLKYAFQTNSKIYLVMEYLPGGTLSRFLRQQRRFNEDLAKFYSAEILLGLEYLHDEMGVIYRDLKLRNILLTSEGHIKLTDFGLAKEKDADGKLAYTLAGTPEYLAPEIILGKGHNHMADYWSFGILIFEMLVGKSPFSVPTGNVEEVIENILENEPKMPSFFSETSRDLIKKLLEKDKNKRLGLNGIGEIKKHKFFKDIEWSDVAEGKIKPPIRKDFELIDVEDVNGEEFTLNESYGQNSYTYMSKMTYNTEIKSVLS